MVWSLTRAIIVSYYKLTILRTEISYTVNLMTAKKMCADLSAGWIQNPRTSVCQGSHSCLNNGPTILTYSCIYLNLTLIAIMITASHDISLLRYMGINFSLRENCFWNAHITRERVRIEIFSLLKISSSEPSKNGFELLIC